MEGKIDLRALCKDDNDFLKKYNALEKKIKGYKKYQGKLFSSPDMLYEFLEFDTKISKEMERVYHYASISNDLDLTNNKYNEYFMKVDNLYNKYKEASSFITSEINEHSYNEFISMCKEKKELKAYKNNMKEVFRCKKLIKSKETEEIISILTSSFGRCEELSEKLIATDLSFGEITGENGKKVKLTANNFSNYFESAQRSVRKEAFEKLYTEIKAHENTFAVNLATEVINANNLARIRGFKDARNLSLFYNDINPKIYDMLISGVHQNLPRFYKFYDFKKDALKQKDLHLYDTYANITSKYNKTYSYEEAKDLVLSSLSILGKDYIKTLTKAFSDNWIDARCIETKRTGAYCNSTYLAHPYVVMNYQGKVNDISTLAHELGHAMHFYYAAKRPFQDYGYSIFVAEVASQVNEIILIDYLLKNSNNKEEKKYLLDLILQRFKSTIIRQTMFAEYEDKIHKDQMKGTSLTLEYLTKTYYDLNKLYFGPNVIVDEDIKYEAFRIPHFFYNFYVYQYATGYAAALKIANDIIAGKKGALENYLKFLGLGSTKDPVSSLKVAGVNILDSNIYNEVFDIFEKRLKELRSLYE